MDTNVKQNTAMFVIFTMVYGYVLLNYLQFPDYPYFWLAGITISAWLCGLVFRDMLEELGLKV